MIIPQFLLSRVISRSDLVSNQLLSDDYHDIYNSCQPLGEYGDKKGAVYPTGPSSRKPGCSLKIEWIRYKHDNIAEQHDKSDIFIVRFWSANIFPANTCIVNSLSLKNRIYIHSLFLKFIIRIYVCATTYSVTAFFDKEFFTKFTNKVPLLKLYPLNVSFSIDALYKTL